MHVYQVTYGSLFYFLYKVNVYAVKNSKYKVITDLLDTLFEIQIHQSNLLCIYD